MVFCLDIFLGLIFFALLLRTAFVYRSKRCWWILGLTVVLALLAPFAFVFFSGIMETRSDISGVKVVFPYSILLAHILVIDDENIGLSIALGTPVIQVLCYGLGCAIASHLRKLPRFLTILLLWHGLMVGLAFLYDS